MSAKLGEILIRENLISAQHLREALDYQREHGGRLGYNLVKLGLVTDDMITAVLSRQYGIPSVNLDLFKIDEPVLRLIPQEVAQKYSVIPLSRVGATLTLAMVDPTNVFAMDDIKFMTGLNVEPVVVAEVSIQQAIAKYYGTSREIELSAVTVDDAALAVKLRDKDDVTADAHVQGIVDAAFAASFTQAQREAADLRAAKYAAADPATKAQVDAALARVSLPTKEAEADVEVVR